MKKLIGALAAPALAASLVLGAVTPAEAAVKRITFIAKSSSGVADISYYGDGRSASLDGKRTTWTKKVGAGGYVYTLSVSDFSGDRNRVTCIIKNSTGKVVKKRTAEGTYVSASCTFTKKL